MYYEGVSGVRKAGKLRNGFASGALNLGDKDGWRHTNSGNLHPPSTVRIAKAYSHISLATDMLP